VDLLPTLLGLLGIDEPADIDGITHAQNLLASPREMTPVRTEIFSAKGYHDSSDQARAVRTKEYSYIESYHHRPSASMVWDLQTGSSAKEQADSQLSEHYAGLYWQMHYAGGGSGRAKALRGRRAVHGYRAARHHY
jgi:arylsulfatase A-like enzyme